MLPPVVALVVLVTGCGGNHPAANGTTGATSGAARVTPSASAPSPRLPSPGVPSPTGPRTSTGEPGSRPTPSTPPTMAFHASVSVLSAAMRAGMTGVSWRPDCPVGLDRLRLSTLDYWGVDHAVHQGRLIVNATAATAVTRAFELLFNARFPVTQMRPIDEFGGSDEASMRADNTSAFNCAKVPGTTVWSQHSYGLAVDLDPLENPEVRDGVVDPPTAIGFADRTRSNPQMIAHGDAAWQAFATVGWSWGGDWRSLKDYQHFSANGY